MNDEKITEIRERMKREADDLSEHCACCLILATREAENDEMEVKGMHMLSSYRGYRHAALGLAREFEKYGPQSSCGPDLRYKLATIIKGLEDLADNVIVLAGIDTEQGPARGYMFAGNWWCAVGMVIEFVAVETSEIANIEEDE